MTGRRGGGRPGRRRAVPPSAAAVDAAAPVSRRRGRHDGTAAAEAEAEAGDVSLLYRQPSRRTIQPSDADVEIDYSRGFGTHSSRAGEAASSLASPSAAKGDAAATAARTKSASTSTPVNTAEAAVLRFWQRAAGSVNLSQYLSHCGVRDTPPRHHGSVTFTVTQGQIFHCSADRVETAVTALRNIESLLFVPKDTSATSGAPCVGCACWVRLEHHDAVVALAQLCEVAVPLQLPSLVVSRSASSVPALPHGATDEIAKSTSDAGQNTKLPSLVWKLLVREVGGSRPTADRRDMAQVTSEAGEACAAASASTGTHTIDLVPSPVLLAEVQRRRDCLRRFCQLREAYTAVLPRLHAASTLLELRHLLFAHDSGACLTLSRVRQLWMQANTEYHVNGVAATSYNFGGEHNHLSIGGVGGGGGSEQEVLSSFLGNPYVLDTVMPFGVITARHPQEEALVQHLVTLLRQGTAVDAATWGPMAAMASWRCSDGLYVVQHASRVRALRRVIAEAQFYGLPRFLRSIRVSAASSSAMLLSDGTPEKDDAQTWLSSTTMRLQRAQAQCPDQFFLTPDALDPAAFTSPDAMQAQLVQEELITLQRTHGAFCLLVGEADEVATMLRQHLAHTGKVWQRYHTKKEEGLVEGEAGRVKVEQVAAADADAVMVDTAEAPETYEVAPGGPTSPSSSAPHRSRTKADPLHLYVLHTVNEARKHERDKQQQHQHHIGSTAATTAGSNAPLPFCHVQWIQGGSMNRWSPHTHYYGLVYMVVVETDEWATDDVTLMTEGLLPTTAIAVDAGVNPASLQPPREPTYCVNAMVELWRS